MSRNEVLYAVPGHERVPGIFAAKEGGRIASANASGFLGIELYRAIAEWARATAADDTVRGVVLSIDSFGGEVRGLMLATDALIELSAVKPTTAVVDATATSAAYALASTARRVVSHPSAELGSIAAVGIVVDDVPALEKAGIVVEVYSPSATKQGLMRAPTDEEGRAEFHRHVDRAHDEIQALVRRQRPGIRDEALSGGSFGARQAKELGLVDRIESSSQLADRIRAAAFARAKVSVA